MYISAPNDRSASFPSLHAEHAAGTTLPSGGLALHFLADLGVDVEELADAAVKADGLALVELGFAVRRRNALFSAAGHETAGRKN